MREGPRESGRKQKLRSAAGAARAMYDPHVGLLARFVCISLRTLPSHLLGERVSNLSL